MRKLMWFTLGFGGACAVGAYCYTPWLMVFACAAFLFSAGTWLVRKDWRLWRPIAAVSLGVSLGLCWFSGYRYFYLAPVTEMDGHTVSLSAVASEYSTSNNQGAKVQARIELGGKHYNAVLYLKEEKELKPGDSISGQFRIRLTHEGLEGSTYHRGEGTFVLAYALDNCAYESASSVPLRYYPTLLRRQITNRLDELFPNDVAFFTKALLLGDRSGVDYETDTAFKVSGISHIIAVSGLHVSILFSVIYTIMGKRRLLTALVGIPVLLMFAAVTGFTPSVTRACIMQILMILAMVINRDYDPSTALAAAVLVILTVNPLTVTSPSFQLSVGCMGGILLFSERIKNRIVAVRFWKDWKGKKLRVRLRQWFASGVAVTLSAMVFTTPLVAYYFGCVSLIGIMTNLLTLWAVSWIFYGIMLVCLISLVWQQGAVVIAWLISWLIRYVLGVSKLLSAFPFAAVYTKSIYIVFWVIFCYLLFAIFLIWKKRRPFILLSCAALGLCLAFLCSWIEPVLDRSRMVVLDVGQGQSVILQSEGKTYLIDCGGDSDNEAANTAAETLLSMGVFRLDGVILTHYDRDHAAGMDKLLSRVPADMVFLPRYTENKQILNSILEHSDGRAVYVDEDIRLSWEETVLNIYAPISDISENERGLCVLFRKENCDILITGDVGIDSENRLVLDKKLPPLTALIAGHHGSKNSTGELLLSATTPQYVFISVGVDNSYDHPSSELLKRLEDFECTVYRTDRDGTIVFRR